MSPSVRAPLRTISRTSSRIISRKATNDGCRGVPSFTDNMDSNGSIPVVLSVTTCQENSDDTESRNHSSDLLLKEPKKCESPQPAFSRAPSIVSSSSTDHTQYPKFCQWAGCDTGVEVGTSGLLSHIQDVHVFPQISKKSRYTCWWSGCKVYGRPSVSSNWLSRHVQQHSEAKGKPFSCIFDGCFQRFSSSNLLERHIDRHHVNPDALCGGASTKRSGSLPIMLEKTICGNRNPVSVKNCSRRVAKRKKKLRYFRVRRADFYDFRSKIIIKNRLILDKILAESAIEKLIQPSASPNQVDDNLSGHVALPGPIKDENADDFSSSRRILRSGVTVSADDCPDLLSRSQPLPSKPESYRVKLLLTVPHSFVGQRLTREGKTEYLVKWQGDLCANILPVMWVLEEEVRAAATLDKL
uniref:C2H2-type domain-containing protein n=1 Tax=Mesocestoides corti TaxID=53468 RepID=A0A5K3ELG9_MESCO